MIKSWVKDYYFKRYKSYISNKKKVEFRVGSVINRATKFEGRNLISVGALVKDSSLGFASYVGKKSIIQNCKIGRYTSIGPYVKCIFGTHPTSTFVSTHPAFFSIMKQVGFSFTKEQLFEEFPEPLNPGEPYTIEIGHDVWIGAGVTLIDGIRIGDGAIIAANSLVNKDVEPYSIVGGIPSKHIKYRFTEKQIKFLKEFRWWEKDFNWIQQNHQLFTDIKDFVDQYSTEY